MTGDSLLEAGTVLNLRYRIERVLEEQEDTVTYLAFDSKKEINAVVKEFSPMDWGNDRRLFEIGKRDFMKMAGKIAINSGKRGMVSVSDWFLENGTAYAVEDFIQGTSLMNYVALKRNSGGLSMENIKFFMEDVFKALRSVHKTGIIHGNISPDNILIQENGEAKLIGFSFISSGIKKQAYDFLEYTDNTFPVNNTGYAAPEQYHLKDEWGYACDVYGISAVLYYCITGIVPPESISRLNGAPLQAPRKRGEDISEWEEKVLLKGMELDRKYRYPDLEIMYHELYSISREQEDRQSFSELERKLHAEQDREIFDEVNWQQVGDLEDIEKNLKVGIEQEVSQVRKEKQQTDLRKAGAAKEDVRREPAAGKARGKKKRTVILIILALILIAAAVTALVAIVNSSFFDNTPQAMEPEKETPSPEPTPGLTSEVYGIKAKNVYKVYRDEVTDYAVLVISFTNNSTEAVCLNDIYEVIMQENGTDLKRAENFKSKRFRTGGEAKLVEPGKSKQINIVFYLLDKEINRISVIFNSLTGSGTRVEKRMKLSRKYYDMDTEGNDGNNKENPGEGEPEEREVLFPDVYASSVLPDAAGSNGKIYTYTAGNLIDGDLTTCWSEGQEGDGAGAYIQMSSDEPKAVRGINFYNGNEETAYWFEMNSRVSEISIEFSDGTKIYRSISTDIESQPVNIDFGRDITTEFLKITVVKAMVPEGGYSDTSISEIEVY